MFCETFKEPKCLDFEEEHHCPKPMCKPPRQGCKLIQSEEVNDFGCLKYPCGIEKCEKEEKKMCPFKHCRKFFDGCNECKCEHTTNGHSIVVGCTKMFCETFKEPKCLDFEEEHHCPKPMCKPPRQGCKLIQSEEVNDFGCLKYPCGIEKCEKEEKKMCPFKHCRKFFDG